MKSFVESKLFWTGIAAIAAAGLDVYIEGGDFHAVLLACFGALVVILRRYTTKSMVFGSPATAGRIQAKKAVEQWDLYNGTGPSGPTRASSSIKSELMDSARPIRKTIPINGDG